MSMEVSMWCEFVCCVEEQLLELSFGKKGRIEMCLQQLGCYKEYMSFVTLCLVDFNVVFSIAIELVE